jgi:hypothetical protein
MVLRIEHFLPRLLGLHIRHLHIPLQAVHATEHDALLRKGRSLRLTASIQWLSDEVRTDNVQIYFQVVENRIPWPWKSLAFFVLGPSQFPEVLFVVVLNASRQLADYYVQDKTIDGPRFKQAPRRPWFVPEFLL